MTTNDRTKRVKQSSVDYFRSREASERQAAELATDPQARTVHRQLADGYAILVQRCLEEERFSGMDNVRVLAR